VATECVVDASVILNLTPIRGLSVLLDSKRYFWKITPIARREVENAEARRQLEVAIVSGQIAVEELDLSVEVEADLLAHWSEELDAGEAEAVALAVARGWRVALEDRKGQRLMNEQLGHGRWVNCADLLLHAVDDKRLTLTEAEDLFVRLSCYGGYSRRGVATLADLQR